MERTLIIISAIVLSLLVGCSINFGALTEQAMEQFSGQFSEQLSEQLPTYELSDDEFARAMDPHLDYLILVNGEHPYEFGGIYDRELQNDLAYIADCYVGEATPIEKGALYAFTLLQYDLKQKGMEIGLFNAYRTYEDQEETMRLYPETTVEPGFSEHHTGLVLDIMIKWSDKSGGQIWYTETAERQTEIPEFKVVHETLADYGFIDRYPPDKEAYTGLPSMPFEIRFVGSSEIAHEIMDNGLCLEEYLASK
ncbi:D-alanyl-D-alanine carboxypeptidase family protein [Candidatus Saccharibacteria bacterium]|nr:D-alanyl-D-alanine carboxypeptidase family protein [Candidatus Saccharibacteria bacterium]